MSTNLDTATRFITDFLGKGDLKVADRTAHARIQGITGLKPSGPIDGLDEYKQILTAFVSAFPATRPLKIIDQFASADGTRVVTRFHSWQMHSGDFFGIPASHREILFDETHVATVQSGLITQNIVSATNLEFEMLMAPVLAPLILSLSKK
jgi:predicted ester cyclase